MLENIKINCFITILLVFFFLSYSSLYSIENGIIINKPYKIKNYNFHIFILENEKCFDGEEWHEVMIPFKEGIIIFGEKITILSETYYYGPTKNVLTIIDENDYLIIEGKIIGRNAKIKVFNENIELQFCNGNNELVKYVFEIENF